MPPTGSEQLRYERNDGNKNLMSGVIVDGQTLSFTSKGINTFFYLEDQSGGALVGNWTITQTVGGNANYTKSGTDQIMWDFPNEGNYTVVVSGINPTTSIAFSHTFYVHVGTTVIPTSNVPVKWVSTVPITGGWQVTMKFFLTPGGLGTTAAPYGHAWINECQPSLYDHLALTFTGDSTLVTFTIMNTNNNLYYTNTNGSRFKFTYLAKSQSGNGTSGANGQWASPTGEYFANNTTGSGSMFEFYINLSNGVITTPGGTVHTPGSVNFSMPGAVGDNIFRAQKIGTTMYFWSLYPTNLVSSVYKRAQYKIGLSGTWINFPNTPAQWNNTEYFGSTIAYSTVSGVGDVFIRFGEEISGTFTINPNASTSPSYNAAAGGFSFR
ncbi:MAG: hypothetical protein WCJ57_01305 [Candidatus Falkowbacteria bacterium]